MGRLSVKVFVPCMLLALLATGCHARKKPEDAAFLNCMAEADSTYPSFRSGGRAAKLHAKAAGLCYKGQQECSKNFGSFACDRFRKRYLQLR